MAKTKFTEENKQGRTVIRVNEPRKCIECGDETYYLDYCSEGGICSHECYDDHADKIGKWARGEADLYV